MLRRSLRIAERESPVVGEYKYTPLEDAKECIRLIRFFPSPEGTPFRAEIIQRKLCEAPAYKALSYTWGPPSDALVEIEFCLMTGTTSMGENLIGKVPGAFGINSQCNGGEHETYYLRQRFPISLGLETAMRELYTTIGNNVPIWIDAICIDQNNDVEKGHQVLSMDRIYRGAEEVYIWLGQEAEESGLAMDLLYEYWTICGCGADKEKDPDMLREQFEKKTLKWTSHWRALGKFIKRPWFSRRWIIQENVFAQQKTIFCGKRNTCWESLGGVASIYHKNNCSSEDDACHGDWTLIYNLNWASEKVKDGEEHHLTLAALLVRFYKSRCTNPRDAVYSLVSMARDIDPEDWLPDYSTKSDDLLVFRKAFEHLVHTTQSLDVMCRSTKTRAETVTWLPKFGQVYGSGCGHTSCLRRGYSDRSLTTFAKAIWEDPPVIYSASGSTKPRIRFDVDGRLLFADGYLIDTIKKIPPFAGNSQCRSCNRKTVDLHQWMRVACDMHQGSYDSQEILACFRRSMVGNRTLRKWKEGPEAIEKLSNTWISILEATGCFTDSCGCELFDLTDVEHDLELKLMRSVMKRVMDIVIRDRTFAVTENSLGFVPRIAREGDVVCILLGCSVPVILRPSTASSGFLFLGECYIHGLMEGEYMQFVSENVLEPDEIEIH